MPQIVLDGTGPSKGSLVEGGYDFCGLSSDQFERTPEEMNKGLRLLNGLMSRLKTYQDIDLGYDFPVYGEGLLEEPSGIPDGAREPICALLAQRIAPTIGATLTDDAKAILSSVYQDLVAAYAPDPVSRLSSYLMLTLNRRRRIFSIPTDTGTPATPPVVTPPVVTPPVVTPPVISPPPPAGSVLKTLTLSNSSLLENSVAGTLIGAIQNTSAGSVLSLSDNAGGRFAIDAANNLIAGSTPTNFEAATSHSITIVETLAGDPASPKSTTLSVSVANVLEVTLVDLSGAFALAENAAAGDVAGTLAGMAAGSTLTLVDNAGGRVALSGNTIVRGATALDYETATSHNFTVRETHPDGINSPHDTALVLAVSNVYEQPNLNALALSLSAFTVGSAFSGTIDNSTPGSTIVASGLPSSITINSGMRTFTYSGAGSASSGTFTLTETLADSANSPRVTTISWSISTAGSLATPVLSIFSALNTVPVTFSVSDTDYVAGMYGQLQIATDSGFASVTQDTGAVFVGGAEWAALDAILPFSDPSGTYYARFRFLRDNPGGATTVGSASGAVANYDASPWSNTVTDTITVSVAKWTNTTGTKKSRWITTTNSDLSAYFNANVGVPAGVVATIPAAFSKWHAEIEFTNWNSAGGSLRIGITDGAQDFNSGAGDFGSTGGPVLPGGSAPGFTITVNKAASSLGVLGAGGATITLPAGVTTDVLDRLILEVDESINQVKFYYWDNSAGALANSGAAIATKTLTGTGIPSSWYLWGGGIKGVGGTPASSDEVTLFPVSDKMAYSSGYSMYG